MSTWNACLAVAAAALFASGGAMAAPLFPLSGNAPFVNAEPAAASTLARSVGGAQVAAHVPAAGRSDGTAQAVVTTTAHRTAQRQVSRLPASANAPYFAQNAMHRS